MMEVACGQVKMCSRYISQRELTQQMLIIYTHIVSYCWFAHETQLHMIMDARDKGVRCVELNGWDLGGNFLFYLCTAATY